MGNDTLESLSLIEDGTFNVEKDRQERTWKKEREIIMKGIRIKTI